MHIANVVVANTEYKKIDDLLPVGLTVGNTYTINNLSNNGLYYIVSEHEPTDKGCILWGGDQLIYEKVTGTLWVCTTQDSLYRNGCEIEVSEVE